MKKYLTLFLLWHVCSLTFAQSGISFIENKGQWQENVLFKTELDGSSVFFERDKLTYNIGNRAHLAEIINHKHPDSETSDHHREFVDFHAYKVHFRNAIAQPGFETGNAFYDYKNYFIGNNPSKWAGQVKHFDSFRYLSLYKGIDLKFNSVEDQLKYEFVVEPHADPAQILLEYEGVDKISVKQGRLSIELSFGRVEELEPYAYHLINGEQVEIACKYKLNGNLLSYHFPKGYDPNFTLYIDPPVLIFSSYSGSTSDNWGYTATYDEYGFLYAGGNVFGIGYPTTTGAYQQNYAGANTDIAISKYDTTGATLVYSTYLGGLGTEVPHSLIVNSSNELMVMGTTSSSNYPVTSNAYDQTFAGGPTISLTGISYSNGSDIVISRFSSDGASLLASTFFGGTSIDGLNNDVNLKYNYADEVRGEIEIDHNNNVYIATCTRSSDLPVTPGAFQTVIGGGQDGFVAKFDSDLSTLIWCSYLGGANADAIYSITLDSQDDLIVAGGTSSPNFPITNNTVSPVFQGALVDGFITHFDKLGNQIINSTFYGSVNYDQVYFVEVDKQDNIYVAGQTEAAGNTFIYNALWNNPGGGQFITKLSHSLDNIVWSTAFGNGSGPDISPSAFLVDYCNRISLAGWGGLNGAGGTSGLQVTSGAIQPNTNGSDYYFMVMEADASGLYYATFFGGQSAEEHVDGGTSRYDKKGVVYQSVCAGCGGFDDFPTTTGAWSQVNNSSNCNNGVIKLDFDLPLVIADFDKPATGCAPFTANLINKSKVISQQNTIVYWEFGDGTTSNNWSPTKIYNQSGIYNIMLVVTDSSACNISDTLVKQLVILSNSRDTVVDANICKGDYTHIGVLPSTDPSITYQWTPWLFLSSTNTPNPIADPPVTTDYTLIVSNGVCTDTLVQRVNVFDIEVDAGPDTTLCQPNTILSAYSTTPNLNYHWSSNNQFTNMLNTSLSNNTLAVNTQGTQTFYVKAYNAYCESIDSVTITLLFFVDTTSSTNPLCFGDCNGSASVNVTGGAPTYTYQWSGNPGTGPSISGLCAGTYQITITDQNGCYTVRDIVLTNPPELNLNLSKIDIPCDNICIGEIDANPSGGTPAYSFLWDDPNTQTTNPATQLCEGTYHVLVTDTNGCFAEDSITIIDQGAGTTIEATANPDTIFSGQTTQLDVTVLGSNYYYDWIPPNDLNDATIANPEGQPPVTTTYIVTVSDAFGCEWEDSVTVFVEDVFCEEPYIFIPNAFSPNGDNVNDKVYVRSKYIDNMYFAIYDRWGERLFETTDPMKGWDGNFRGKAVPPGIYVYYLKLTCYNHVQFVKKGNITVIK